MIDQPRRGPAAVKAVLDCCFIDCQIEVEENASLIEAIPVVPWLAVTLRQGTTSVTYIMEPNEPPYYVAEKLAGMWGRRRLLKPNLFDDLENLAP